jgi:hypothetical protein
MTRSPIQWILTIAGLSGIISIFLPFTWDVRPLDAVLFRPSMVPSDSATDIWFLATPFLLSAVISASVIRWNFSCRSTLSERTIPYLLGSAVMVIVTRTNIILVVEGVRNFFDSKMLMLFILSAGSLIAGIFLVIRNHRLGKYKSLSPIMLMQTAYVSNGIICLIRYWGGWGGWQIGAYYTLVTVSVYVAQMVWIGFQKKDISAVKSQEF